MKKRKILPALLAAALVLSASIGPALAYFSAYSLAAGGGKLSLLPVTTITETQVNENMKKLVVTNSGSAPCFVRVLAFPGGGVTLGGEGGSGWEPRNSEGYWYYAPVLAPGETSAELEIPLGDLPTETDEFHVVVLYESTPAIWDEASGAYRADWSLDVTVVEADETGGQGA